MWSVRYLVSFHFQMTILDSLLPVFASLKHFIDLQHFAFQGLSLYEINKCHFHYVLCGTNSWEVCYCRWTWWLSYFQCCPSGRATSRFVLVSPHELSVSFLVPLSPFISRFSTSGEPLSMECCALTTGTTTDCHPQTGGCLPEEFISDVTKTPNCKRNCRPQLR